MKLSPGVIQGVILATVS